MATIQIPQKCQNPPQPPPLFTGTKVSILNDTNAIIDGQRAVLDKISGSFTPQTATFEGVMEAIARDDGQASLKTRVLAFYLNVSPDPEVRQSSTEAKKALDGFSTESAMREDIFKLIDALYQRRGSLGLDPESLRLLEKAHKNYISNGLGIPAGPQRDRFKEIQTQLTSLTSEFNKNYNEEDGGVWFTAEELRGVPDDVVSNLKQGSGENDGKRWLTFKYPHLYPTLKYAVNPETRRRYMLANENKCNQNSPIFKEAIVLRDEAARLLGFGNHAELKLPDKMAKSPQVVNEFLNDLCSRLTPLAKKELHRLKQLKADDCRMHDIPFDDNYYLWDHRYYDRLMLEKEYSVDEMEIAEYFPLDTTLFGMLRIFERVMGFVFIKLGAAELARLSPTGRAEDVTWHSDTIIYSVWNDESEGDTFVGYLYMDLHPRQAKYTHAANFTVEPGFTLRDGTRHYPATALVCNFTQPTPQKPSLLKHHEVVMLFHELGHGIHSLAAKCLYTRFHGTATVRDFVEAPSQMLENWCWTPDVLRSLSRHWTTGEKIPQDLAQKLVAAKGVNSALYNLRQAHFGLFDMACHSPKSHADVEAMNPSSLYNDLWVSTTMMKGPEPDTHTNSDWGHGDAILTHLMVGYDAGIHGYLYAKVYSSDMFYSAFKQDLMDGKQGRRYRHTVLEYGGSRDELESLTEFLGRKPNSEAFYQELGISA